MASPANHRSAPPAGRPHGLWEAGRQQHRCVRALGVPRLFALAELEPEQALSHAQKWLSLPHSAPQITGEGGLAQGFGAGWQPRSGPQPDHRLLHKQ